MSVPLLLTTYELARVTRTKPQTWRKKSCLGEGPIYPVVQRGKRGSLLWRRSDVEELFGIKISEDDITVEKTE
jgi:hypothetical protein